VRHAISTILAGVGIFLMTTGILTRFYAAPRLIEAPTNTYQVSTLKAANADYFDAHTLKVRTGATLTATNTVRGDVKASHGDTAVWDSFTAIQDLTNGSLVDVRSQRLAFDRRTAQLTNCCGASVQGDTSVRQSGIGLFWPIHVAKRSYQLFDTQTLQAWPIRYDGQETVRGVRTYRFVGHIPATRLNEKVSDIPGEWLGLGKKSGAVAVDRYYQADITYWIDPRTGAPLNQRQRVLSTLRPRQGTGQLVVADMDLQMTDASQRTVLAKDKDGVGSIQLLTTVVPLACLLLGLLLATSGVLLVFRTRRTAQHRHQAVELVAAPTE
jgi:hypothetical protein